MEIAFLALGLVLGALIGWLITRARRSSDPQSTADFHARLAAADATIIQLTERLDDAKKAADTLVEQHRLEREQREAEEREESRVLERLAPVGDVVNKMQVKIDQLAQAQTRQAAEIKTQLSASIEVQNKLSESTQSLSRVMSDSSTRGTWGELQLERVAQLSGLHKGVNYVLQKTVEGEDNRGRPDMTVYLSPTATIAIDAKAPFSAYNEAMAADATPEKRKAQLDKHARDLRSHITALAGREYAKNLTGKVDYVICFVPADSILVAALETDPDLLEFAVSKKVVLAGPSSLIAVLRPVALNWHHVENAQRASEIVEMGKELYSRLSTMASHAARLGKSIQTTSANYNSFVGSLEKNVLVQARRFDKLDASDLPELVEIDGTVNLFNTPELRGMNAELETPQQAIGNPIDAEVVSADESAEDSESAR